MSLTPMDLVAEAKAQITEIDLQTAHTALLENPVLIDVREVAEYDISRLPNAINIPRGVLEFKAGDHPALADKHADIILYCKTSGRAALSAANLQRLGYTRIRSIHGGFDAWQAAGHTVISDHTAYGD